MSTKPKLVAFLGAGASQAVGLPGTLDLSKAVLSALRKTDGYPVMEPACEEIERDIRTAWPPRVEPLINTVRRAGSENFETDMQVFEAMMTFAPHDAIERAYADLLRRPDVQRDEEMRRCLEAQQPGEPPRDSVGRGRPRPPAANLVNVAPLFPALVHRETLLNLMGQLVVTVRDELERAEAAVDGAKIDAVAAFFAELVARYDVSFQSFNYDRTARIAVERVLGTLEDGFVPQGDFGRFEVRRFLDAAGPRFAQLHGSLDYRVRPRDVQGGSFYEVVKIPLGAMVPQGYHDLEEAATQAEDFAMIGSLITGLHKADMTRTEPYGTYAYALERELYQAQRVLFIGYGGGDTYVNMQLLRARAYHGTAWKPAVVTSSVPRPTEPLYALCGVLSGMEGRQFLHASNAVPADGGVGMVGGLHLDIRGFLAHADQAESIARTLA